MIKKDKMFPLNLQYFADGDAAANNDNDQNGQNGDSENGNNGSDVKTFTQDQVSALMAKEKNEGKRSVLKSLGFKNEDEAKDAIKLYNALIDSQKSKDDLHQEEIDKANKDKNEYLARAQEAEDKLSCFQAGVSKESIDDVLAIAKIKVTETKNLDSVLKDMKKEAKYSSFFENTEKKNNGTGNDPGHSGGSNSGSAGDYGKRLAEKNQTSSNENKKQSSFFF